MVEERTLRQLHVREILKEKNGERERERERGGEREGRDRND